MLRCGEGATTEVLVVLVEPLPPRTHPKVSVVAGRNTTEFTGSIVTPGALVLLPEKASALVENVWQSVPELTVAIADNHRSLHGVIPLADIGTAMRTLQSNCPEGTRSR
jgi:S-adenosylmethionine synthetase